MPIAPLYGSHLSAAGGVHNAAAKAGELGLAAVQVFTKSNHRWAVGPLTGEGVAAWHAAREAAGVRFACAHASYLINPASPDGELREKSVAALAVELERAAALGLAGVVVHPGSHVGSGVDAGLDRVAGAVADVLGRTAESAGGCELWLENTAGQGTALGADLAELGTIFAAVPARHRGRLGVCFDTCHAFAAGYDLRTAGGYAGCFEELGAALAPLGEAGPDGLDRLRCLHVNDSKTPLGSRVDRHEHIGLGTLGDDAFRRLVTDPRLFGKPFVLETPKKDNEAGVPWDTVNVGRLRGLART